MLHSHPSRRLLGALLALLAMSGAVCASEVEGSEAQTIAERICTFPRFVEWPARKFSQPDAPFVIGVFGVNSVTDLLREAIQDRRIKDRAVVVKQVLAREELPGCHLVFISGAENTRLEPVLRSLRREGVLTVGQSESFLSHGGIINLVTVGGTVRFQINLDAAKRERLTVSSKLLQLALPQYPEVVGSTPSGFGFGRP